MLSHDTNDSINDANVLRDEISAILLSESADSISISSVSPETFTSPTLYLTPIQTADFQQTMDALAEDVSKFRERKGSQTDLGKQVEEAKRVRIIFKLTPQNPPCLTSKIHISTQKHAQSFHQISSLHAQIKSATTKSESIKLQSQQITSERERVAKSIRNLENDIQEYGEKKKEAKELLSQMEQDVRDAEMKLGKKLEKGKSRNTSIVYAVVGAVAVSLLFILKDLQSALGWLILQP
ncbi:hypothetical protein HK097_006710 [Rhizophlyctis rosea]|uniref:Uncharacterized protein n=1 Tax=Rhizophlyctis rosea TaxID=64517 RepID=A0AAD5X6C8_9FUNG|nr:hypothetical protein HK097_006710 [Rhizophlyctis rosea]